MVKTSDFRNGIDIIIKGLFQFVTTLSSFLLGNISKLLKVFSLHNFIISFIDRERKDLIRSQSKYPLTLEGDERKYFIVPFELG